MLENNSAPFTFVKSGVFYFTRRVPTDLKGHYTSQKVSFSLRTRSPRIAGSRAIRAAQQLDEHWYHLRLRDTDLPGRHLLKLNALPGETRAETRQEQAQPVSVTLREAVGIYLRLKGQGKPKTFQRAAERSCGYLIDVCGDRPIGAYTKVDANAFRDALIAKGLAGSSITRVFGTVRSIVNFAASEMGETLTNPFGNVYYDRSAGVEGRVPVPLDAIKVVQTKCRSMDDDLRWLVALITDTGMRLAEAAGLHVDDLILDGEGPAKVVIREHPWRRLKNAGSRREVPLVGASLWAAQRILSERDDTGFAFPRYNTTDTTNANSASAALNKWMKPMVPKGCTMHSFRHSMRDRLRAVECPADIVDQIGGWQTDGVGHSYGTGYPMDVLSRWMKAIE